MAAASQREVVRRRDKLDLGLCILKGCPNEFVSRTSGRCKEHKHTRLSRFVNDQDHKDVKINKGLCIVKGCDTKASVDRDKKTLKMCVKHRELDGKFRAKRYADGLCVICNHGVREGVNDIGTAWTHCDRCYEKISLRNILKKSGLSVGAYERMNEVQGGLCAICNRPEKVSRRGKVQRLAVDHDHKTGVIRSLLCSQCNLTVGHIESTNYIEEILSYIERHKFSFSEFGEGR